MRSLNECAKYLGLVILVFFRYAESEPSCDKRSGALNNCHCRYSDGKDPPTYRDIDFSPLGRNDGKPAFPYKENPSDDYKYAYNPCHPFQDEFCTEGTAACQVSKNEQHSYPLGNPDVVAFEVIDSNFVLTYGEVHSRVAVVNFTCDERALTKATYEPLGELQEGFYHFQIGTCLACLKDIPNCHSSHASSGLTAGAVICIIFAVLVIVYLVGGILFQTLGRGATGIEAIPNYEFWSDLPNLIKDGFMFLIRVCKGSSRGSDYESIK